tara:strand:- start:42435 stop:43244 length:810 start_codon:yes stop_codon:yes gene_type:complete
MTLTDKIQAGMVYIATNATAFSVAHSLADGSENFGYWLASSALGWGLGLAINYKIPEFNPKVLGAAFIAADLSAAAVYVQHLDDRPEIIETKPVLGQKVAVIGASNTKNGQYVMELGKLMPDSTFDIFAESGYKPSQQIEELMPKALAYKPDTIIICPSGNGVNQSGYVPRVKELIAEAGDIPTILLTVSPRRGNESVYKFKDVADELGADLVVDITTPLQHGRDCGYCISDGYHWNPEGHKIVAETIRDTVNKEWGKSTLSNYMVATK